jgi:hypothetical protein
MSACEAISDVKYSLRVFPMLTRFRHSSPRNDVGALARPPQNLRNERQYLATTRPLPKRVGSCTNSTASLFPASPGANISLVGAISHKLAFDLFAYALLSRHLTGGRLVVTAPHSAPFAIRCLKLGLLSIA